MVTTLIDDDNWIVGFDDNKKAYTISYFSDGHFKDEIKIFDIYQEEQEIIQVYNEFGEYTHCCPRCWNPAIINPYGIKPKIYKYCPECGQKLTICKDNEESKEE